MDKRSSRVQPIRLANNFFPLDLHKSMFINDLIISIPTYYVTNWGGKIIDTHDKENCKWEVELIYESPKVHGKKKMNFNAVLSLSFSRNRKKENNYRLKWKSDFAIQLAKDYPKSFVRSLEFHIGDEFYKELKYTEFDIGGFKEQLQVLIKWIDNKPKIIVKEFFRVREEAQDFPKVYNELSSYLIADYLISDKEELLRRVQMSNWKSRDELDKELNENNIYLLLNREKKEIYFGETKKALSRRYPKTHKHHSFEDWNEYSIIQLPPETTDNTRLLIERVLIAVGSKLFPNEIYKEESLLDSALGYKLKNRKK